MISRTLLLFALAKISSQNQIHNLSGSIKLLSNEEKIGKKLRENLREWSRHANRIQDMKRSFVKYATIYLNTVFKTFIATSGKAVLAERKKSRTNFVPDVIWKSE